MKNLFVSIEFSSINSEEKIREFFSVTEAGSCLPISKNEFLQIFENSDESNLSGLIKSELPVFQKQDLPIYDFHDPQDKPRVFYYNKIDEKFTPPMLFTFFTEYPWLAQYLANKDFLNAAKLLVHSENLLENIQFTKYVLKENAFTALCFYWMSEFNNDKDEELSFLLKAYSGDSNINLSAISYHSQPYARLLKYAQGSFDISEFSDFRKMARERIREILLDKNAGTVLPITGTNFSNGLDNLISQVHSLSAESLKHQIIDGVDQDKTRLAIKNYFESFEISILPEPNNNYDPNAVSVIFKGNDGVNRQIGYIKREFAAILSPLMQKGNHFKTKLFRLTDSNVNLYLQCL